MKRMLDVLRPKIEAQFKTWGSCMPATGSTAPGERLSEVTVMLRSKFRNYLQGVVEKLAENVSIYFILGVYVLHLSIYFQIPCLKRKCK